MKKRLFPFLSFILLPLFMSAISINNEVFEVEEIDSIYAIDEYQDLLDNLLVDDSIYIDSTNSSIRLRNSFRLKKDNRSDNITLCLDFNATISNSSFYLNTFNIYNDSKNSVFTSPSFYLNNGDTKLVNNIKMSIVKKENLLFISFDLSYLKDDYILFLGEDTLNSLIIDIKGNKNIILNKAKLYFGLPNDYKENSSSLSLSDHIYLYGDTFTYTTDLSKKEPLESILKKLSVNKEELEIINDEYSKFLSLNKLGEAIVDLKLKSNGTPLYLKINLVDKTPPRINSTNDLTISYLELNDDLTLDLSKYYFGFDDCVGRVEVYNNIIKPPLFCPFEQPIIIKDPSGNTSTSIVNINIIDDQAPVILSDTSISVYRYSKSSKTILSSLNITDGLGSGIKEIKILNDEFKKNYGQFGTFNIDLLISDNYNNKTYQTISVEVKKEIGPIEFIELEDYQIFESEISEENLFSLLPFNDSKISDYTFITPLNDLSNKEVNPVQLIVFLEDGTPEYYSFNLKVKQKEKPNTFSSIWSNICSFFETIFTFFKEFFLNIKNLF